MPRLTPYEPPLSEADVLRGYRNVAHETAASNAMETLTTGVFMVGFALQLGASSTVIGLFAAIPFLGHLFQLPSIWLVHHFRHRKLTVMLSCVLARSFLLAIACVPFLPSSLALWVMGAALCFRYSIGAISACAWNSWMRDLVPTEMLGRFMGRAMLWLTAAAVLMGLSGGYFLDWWQTHPSGPVTHAYVILYVVGFGFGMLSVFLQTRIPEPRMTDGDTPHLHARDVLVAPLRNINFRRWVAFLTSCNFALNLTVPFLPVVMLTTLGFSNATVIGVIVLGQCAFIAGLRVWGLYADRFSHKTVLGICLPLVLACLLCWAFAAGGHHAYTLPLIAGLMVVMGIGNAGVTLANGALALKLAPARSATAFLAANSVLGMLANGIAPLVGGLMADTLKATSFSIDLRWGSDTLHAFSLTHWDFLFLLAFAVGLYALHRLAYIEETGAHDRRAALRALVSDTARILRGVTSIPLNPVRRRVRRGEE